jgi:hypothetical protein
MPADRLDLTALAQPYRYRVVRDEEGRPVIPGRLGQIEPHDGQVLAVYTDHPRLFARLWAIPGVRRWQVGDQEARALVPVERLPEAAALIQARRRRRGRLLTSDQALRLRAGARIGVTSAP